jgi:hypothetical protein
MGIRTIVAEVLRDMEINGECIAEPAKSSIRLHRLANVRLKQLHNAHICAAC